jgi:hypothetical protein
MVDRRRMPHGESTQRGRGTFLPEAEKRETGRMGWKIAHAAILAAILAGIVGCATGENLESVWVQIIPGRFYTFQDVQGETDGETLYVTGKIEAVGYFERGYVPFVVIGRGQEGEIVAQKKTGTWMKGRKQRFYTEIPYKPNVDYTIRAESDGLLSDINF